MQQRFISEVAESQAASAAGGVSPIVGNVQFHAPAGSWLPTELGEEVLDALLHAGAAFAS